MTFAGSPEMEKVTLLLKPFSGSTFTPMVPPVLTGKDKLEAAMDRLKLAVGAETTKVKVTEAVRLPEVPVTVTVLVLAAVPVGTKATNWVPEVELVGVTAVLTAAGKPE